MHHRRRGDCLRAVGTTGNRPNTPTNRRNTSPTCASNSARCAWSASSWGLRLGGTATRKKYQDKWAIEEVKGFSAIDFRGFGEDEQTSTFLFLPAFVPALSDQQASFLSPVAQNGYVPLPSCCSSQPQTPTPTLSVDTELAPSLTRGDRQSVSRAYRIRQRHSRYVKREHGCRAYQPQQ